MHLPSELIEEIFECFCLHCYQKVNGTISLHGDYLKYFVPKWAVSVCHRSLTSLSLVCREFRPIAQRVLHHHYGIVEDQSETFPLFFRTISNVPGLAEHVKVLNIKPVDPEVFHREANMKEVKSLIERHGSHLDFSDFQRPESDGLRSIVPALAVLQMPRLETLFVTGESQPLFRWLKRQSETKNKLLPRLKVLKIAPERRGPDEDDGSQFHELHLLESNLGGFLSDFTRLEQLELNNVRNAFVPANLCLSRLSRLHLECTRLSKTKLRRFINAAPKLKEFKYRKIEDTEFPGMGELYRMDGENPATANEILELLTSLNDTLEKVDLATHWRNAPLTALPRLTSLKELRLNGRALYDVMEFTDKREKLDANFFYHLFPPSLEKFGIQTGHRGLMCLADALICFCKTSQTGWLHPAARGLQTITLWNSALDDTEEGGYFGADWREPARAFQDAFAEQCHEWLDGGKRSLEFECWFLEQMTPGRGETAELG